MLLPGHFTNLLGLHVKTASMKACFQQNTCNNKNLSYSKRTEAD
jgi:hypothetical protein